MKTLDMIARILLIIGGLNWGLVGLLQFNLVEMLFGHLPIVAKTVYGLVGASALYEIFQCKGSCNLSK